MATVSPLVSVCIPTYNRASLLEQAIQSVLAQTLENFELLVSDNASTDDTEAVVKSFDDPRIRYVRNETNLGHWANYSRCLQLARGAYLTMLSDDDIMMPENIAAKADVLSKYPRVGFVHSKFHVIDGSGEIKRYNTNWMHGPDRMEDTIETGQDALKGMLLVVNPVNTPTVMFRRTCYERVGGYTNQLAQAFDFEFWMRIALYYDVAFLAQPLLKWRFHQGSLTSHHLVRADGMQAPANWKELFGARMLIIKEHFHELENGAEIKKQVSENLCQKVVEVAENLLESGAPKAQARKFIFDMYRLLPGIPLQRAFWKTALKSIFMSSALTRLKCLLLMLWSSVAGVSTRGKRTRLVCVTKSFAAGGTEKVLAEFIQRLDRAAVDPVILCYGTSAYIREVMHRYGLTVEIRDIGAARGMMDYWCSFVNAKPWVIWFINADFGIFPWQAYVAAKLCGARRLVSIEHLLAEPLPGEKPKEDRNSRIRDVIGWRARYRLKMKMQGLLCTKTLCVSDGVRKRLVEEYRFPNDKMAVVLNGVNLRQFGGKAESLVREDLKIGDSEVVLVCIARLEQRKRVGVLLQALHSVLQADHQCKCIVVGEGPSRDALASQSQDLGLSEVVYFVGFSQDVRPYLAAADIYVTPSEREGFGLTLVEAMACGLPCIATDIAGHTEVVVNDYNGLLCTVGSSADLACCIQDLLVNREKRLAMGVNSRKRAEEHFDIEEVMARQRAIVLN